MRPGLTRLVGALLAALAVLLLLPGAARADPAAHGDPSPDAVPEPPTGRPWFGPGLDWTEQLPADYSGRLGAVPSLYAQRVDYPLQDEDETYLEQFAQQAATEGAVALLTLEPQEALSDLTARDAERLADRLAALHRAYDSFFLVRFAPEMNGSWVTWGQQPQEYVAAFRRVATAVHAATDQAAMVWSPAYGAGYPFGTAYGAVDPDRERRADQLDTDGDGEVDDADDPYGPYFPGAQAVDWVGLSLYRFGRLDQAGIDESPSGEQLGEQFDTNTAPEPGEFEGRLAEELGYGDPAPRTSFYDRFAAPDDTPFLVETGALYDPHVEGAEELSVKRSWWRQVFAAVGDHPLVAAISWLELDRREAEADDRTVRWGAARTERLAAALRPDLRRAPITLGPVTRVLDLPTGNAATAQGRLPDASDQSDEMGWIVLCAALLAVAFLAAGLVGRWRPTWRYPHEHDPRDQRLDLFRGCIILTVVFTHVEVAGLYGYLSLNAIGAITGAEMFVLLSGVVLGMVYLPGIARIGEAGMAVTMLRRARKQYFVTLAVVLLVWLLGRLPAISTSVVTTFTDRGTGENGEAATGQVYDLYPNVERLFDYPPPWFAVKQLLLVEMGPWVFNIMGLFVVLSLALPAMVWLVRRGLWWLLLAGSWVLFALNVHGPVHLLPSQFEYVFPLLSWQVLFTHGLVLGTYRRQVTRALVSRWGKVACGVFVVGYAAALVYLWAGHHFGFLAPPFPEDAYGWLYHHGYDRVFLQPGRLVDCVLVVICVYAVLTTCWKPVDAAVGWLWTPLGSASLYVFVVHVFFVIAVGNIAHLDRTAFWVGTVIHTAIMLAIWLMVRKKVLFSVIPR